MRRAPRSPLARRLAMVMLLAGALGPACAAKSSPEATPDSRQPQETPGAPGTVLRELVAVRRELVAGAVYRVQIEQEDNRGTRRADTDVKIVSAATGESTVLDIVLTSMQEGSSEPWRGDVHMQMIVPEGQAASPLHLSGGGFDPRAFELYKSFFHRFDMERCQVPQEPHGPGDSWVESTRDALLGAVAIHWQAGPAERDADGVWASYSAQWHTSLGGTGVPTKPSYRVDMRVRVDDGFVGKCEVSDITSAPEYTARTRLTSTRVLTSGTTASARPAGPDAEQRPADRHTIEDLSEGIKPTKEKARRECARLARAGDKPAIKLEISGPEGRVRAYEIVDDAGNPKLARCIAEAIQRDAIFRKITKEKSWSMMTVSF